MTGSIKISQPTASYQSLPKDSPTPKITGKLSFDREMKVQLSDFQLWGNKWETVSSLDELNDLKLFGLEETDKGAVARRNFQDGRGPQPLLIKDSGSTGRLYFNHSEREISSMCFKQLFLAPIFYSITSLFTMAHRIGKLLTFYHFWETKEGEEKYNFRARLADAGKDLLKVVASPLAVVALELAAFYGAFISPYDGRKLFASIERAVYGDLVPGVTDSFFQPIEFMRSDATLRDIESRTALPSL